MNKTKSLIGLLLASAGTVALAAGADLGQAEKQATICAGLYRGRNMSAANRIRRCLPKACSCLKH